MAAGRVVLLDVSAPAQAAPIELLRRIADARPLNVDEESSINLRAGIIDFSERPTAAWIVNAVQSHNSKGAALQGGRYVTAPDPPR